jgi:type III secretion apparatus needle protein
MPLFTPNSNFTLGNITSMLGNALFGQEQAMYAQLAQLQSNPNPSQQQLVVFQANMQIWAAMIELESSIVKTFGDAMKQVVTNMGS